MSYRLPLYEADVSLLRAFVLLGGLDVNPEERQAEAIESQRSARKIIQRYGYSLRQPELDILGAYVASLEGREAEKKALLALAQSAVEKRNSIRLRSEWQAVVEKMASLRGEGLIASTAPGNKG